MDHDPRAVSVPDGFGVYPAMCAALPGGER